MASFPTNRMMRYRQGYLRECRKFSPNQIRRRNTVFEGYSHNFAAQALNHRRPQSHRFDLAQPAPGENVVRFPTLQVLDNSGTSPSYSRTASLDFWLAGLSPFNISSAHVLLNFRD
jgi:hypothetical protein